MYSATTSSVTLPLLQQKYPRAHRCRPQNCFRWPAPQNLVQPKWESSGRLSHGGTHEQAKDRPGSRAYPARSRPRSGQGTDRPGHLSKGRNRANNLLSLASAIRPRPGRRRAAKARAGTRGRPSQEAGGRVAPGQADAPGHRKKKVVSPDQQRAAADYLSEHYGISQRRICRVMGRSRSVLRYSRNYRADEPALERDMKRLARRHPRYGYRRIHALLLRAGWSVNLKRVRRLWISLGLRRPLRLRKPRKLGPKPGTSANSCVQQPARFKNDVWTCDFIHDRTASGRSLKWLTLVDEYTRECLVLHADSSITGADVRRIVARVIGRRGAPTRIRSDNGSEFICEALVNWLPGVGAESIPVAAGSPWENGYIESFHSRLRDEFLERVEFESVADAREKA